MGSRCWSSLVAGVVNHVGNCLLGTADLDCYMALRAVCHNWRDATDDPKNSMDTRFRPHHWVMVEYPSHGADARLLVNTASGRCLVRYMPLLSKYYIISITTDGLLGLAAKVVPHTTCILNLFTGHMVRFAARMLPNVLSAAVSGSSPPYLILYCYDSMKLYRAIPDSESFVRYMNNYECPLVREVVQGCVTVDGHQGLLPPLPALVVAKIADLMTSSWKSCFLVESDGETLVIFKLDNRVEVFKMDGMCGNTLECVKSIGSHAIFIGRSQRYISLNAGNFPSIEDNCIYFTDSLSSSSTNIYHLKDGEQVESSVSIADGARPSIHPNLPTFLRHPMTAHPLTIIQLLSLYTFNIQSVQASLVLEYEDCILERLRTGQISLDDILEAYQEDSDADD